MYNGIQDMENKIQKRVKVGELCKFFSSLAMNHHLLRFALNIEKNLQEILMNCKLI